MSEAAAESIPAESTPESTPENPPDNVTTITDWRDSLPPELKDNPSLQDVNDVATLAKRFVDTKSMVGNSLRIPTDDAGAEQISEFTAKILQNKNLGLMRKPDPENPEAFNEIYSALGRPEDASGYELVDGADPEMFGAIAAIAHENGLSQKQLQAIASKQIEMTQARIGAMEEQRLEGVRQLQGEWGMAFEEKANRVKNLIKQMGGHEALETAMENGNIDAATLRLFDKFATQLGAEGSPMAAQVGQVTQETPDELRQREQEIFKRLTTEDLTPQQYQDLMNKRLKIMDKLQATGG